MAAIFVFPPFGNFSLSNNGNPINVYDDLTVQYTTTWTSVNLTLFCAANITYSSWGFYNVLDNPLPLNGSYHIGSVQAASFNIDSFPSICFLRLTKYGENDKSQAGNGFTITSDARKSTTFTPPAQSTSSGRSVLVAATRTTDSSIMSSSTSTIDTSLSLPASSTGSSSNAISDLSTAAKAGIGVGVSVAALIILGLVLVILSIRRQLSSTKAGSDGKHEPPEAAAQQATVSYPFGEKASRWTETHDSVQKYELAGSEVHEMHDPEVRIPQLPD